MQLVTILILFFGSIFLISDTSIGIQCYNKNPNYQGTTGSKGFLIFNLIIGIVMLLASFFYGYIYYVSGGGASGLKASGLSALKNMTNQQ